MADLVTTLAVERERLLEVAHSHFRNDPRVEAIFLSGSLASGTTRMHSDIDLRVVVRPDHLSDFLERRHEIPCVWPGFAFSEEEPGTNHSVSHFLPFGKIDIFYYAATDFLPSPWLALPTRVLLDRTGLVASTIEQSLKLSFSVDSADVSRSIGKALAYAHEAYRRQSYKELLYAEAALSGLRKIMMQSDDWIHHRYGASTPYAGFENRGSPEILQKLTSSFGTLSESTVRAALATLLPLYRDHVIQLHEAFDLNRPVTNDLAAIDAVLRFNNAEG